MYQNSFPPLCLPRGRMPQNISTGLNPAQAPTQIFSSNSLPKCLLRPTLLNKSDCLLIEIALILSLVTKTIKTFFNTLKGNFKLLLITEMIFFFIEDI